jgi:hypothetical protein
MNKQLCMVALLAGLIQPLHAEPAMRRATIILEGGRIAKCTVDLIVDGSAQLEIYGDTGELTTLPGQQSVWRSFQCSAPLPYDPSDFRFNRIGGKGQVRLLRDPRSNKGRAVIRIDDPSSGRERYTFDLQWYGTEGGGRQPFPAGAPGPPGAPYGRGPGPIESPMARAVRNCQDSVSTRINQSGYPHVTFGDTIPDGGRGRHDWLIGFVTASRRFETKQFSFSCSVDFNSGWVRSVDIRPQYR